MKGKFLPVDSRRKAQKKMPWAGKIVKVNKGYLGFLPEQIGWAGRDREE